MKAIQTIQLDDNEKLALQQAFGLIDEISNITKTSMNDVFSYLVEQTDVSGTHNYTIIDDLIDISKL